MIFGIRELNSTETERYCQNIFMNGHIPISDRMFNFTSNYKLRVYQSGCYYLDSDHNWQSDGLLVSILMNMYYK